MTENTRRTTDAPDATLDTEGHGKYIPIGEDDDTQAHVFKVGADAEGAEGDEDAEGHT